MDEKERKELEKERCEAKYRCKETYATICQLESILKQYRSDHERWRKRFESADRTLAEEDGRKKVVKAGERKVSVELTLEQIEELAKKLGVELEKGGD